MRAPIYFNGMQFNLHGVIWGTCMQPVTQVLIAIAGALTNSAWGSESECPMLT